MAKHHSRFDEQTNQQLDALLRQWFNAEVACQLTGYKNAALDERANKCGQVYENMVARMEVLHETTE